MKSSFLIAVAALTAAVPLTAANESSSTENGRKLSASLSGAAERPGPGDSDGSGRATVRINPGQGQLCYTVTYTGIAAPTAAHIHEAPVTSAGPVVVPLRVGPGGVISGCATVTRELALEIIREPGDYYVNVHNAAFPAGAIRGQLGK